MGTAEERERERLIKEVVGRLGLYRNWDRINDGNSLFTLWNRDEDIDRTLDIIRHSSILINAEVPATDWDDTTLLSVWMEAMGIPVKTATIPNMIKFQDWLLKPVPLPKEETGKETGKGPFSIKEKDKEKESSGDGSGSGNEG